MERKSEWIAGNSFTAAFQESQHPHDNITCRACSLGRAKCAIKYASAIRYYQDIEHFRAMISAPQSVHHSMDCLPVLAEISTS